MFKVITFKTDYYNMKKLTTTSRVTFNVEGDATDKQVGK